MYRLRNTLRRAYLDWQTLEAKREAARQELNRNYLALRQVAEGFSTQGILAEARLVLEEHQEPGGWKTQRGLEQAFQVLGKGSWRRAPASLRWDISQHGRRLEETCRRYHRLSARLQLAREILAKLTRNPEEPDADRFLRLALTVPEAASVLLHLRQRRLAHRQARQDCLTGSLRARAAACRRWLELLQDSLSARTSKQCKKSLRDLLEKTAAPGGQEAMPELLSCHRKLDSLTGLMNRRAGQQMAVE